MKLRYCRANSGNIREPVQATHHSPAQVETLQTNGGCIFKPVLLMTPLHLQNTLHLPFLSPQRATFPAALSKGLPLANFWMVQGSGSQQRLLLMTLSEDVGLTFLSLVQVFLTTNHLIFSYLFLKYQELNLELEIYAILDLYWIIYKLELAPLMLHPNLR